jgi:hypothetical protein
VRRNFYSYRVALPVEQAVRVGIVWKDADGDVVPRG